MRVGKFHSNFLKLYFSLLSYLHSQHVPVVPGRSAREGGPAHSAV